ncbi:MAG TPA: hypothetical protein VGG33_01125, partial [Polyangia bacterium]
MPSRKPSSRKKPARNLLAVLIAGIVAAAAGPAAAELPAGMSALLDAAEDHDAEVVRFAEGQPAGAALVLATRVAAEPGRLIASLAEPATYQRAVPAFVKAEVRETGKTVAGGPAGPDRLIAWELEVPLWNFAGT